MKFKVATAEVKVSGCVPDNMDEGTALACSLRAALDQGGARHLMQCGSNPGPSAVPSICGRARPLNSSVTGDAPLSRMLEQDACGVTMTPWLDADRGERGFGGRPLALWRIKRQRPLVPKGRFSLCALGPLRVS